MITSSDARASGDSGIEDVITERVVQRAQEWFPGHASTAPVRIDLLSRRPSCSLFVVRVGSEPAAPRILAKVRRAGTAGPAAADRPASARPSLGSGPLAPHTQTALEYAGLQSIHALFGTGDPAFGVVRPLEHLPDRSMILMDYVDAGTLRQHLMQQSRLQPHRRQSSRGDATPWRRAGQWLKAFQSLPEPSVTARQSSRREVIDQFDAYHEYLAGQLGGKAVGQVAARGAKLAASVLPEQLPLAMCHGDYAPRNMFLQGDGRLTVFDPLPRWMVPRYEDLCRFLVGMRLLGLQVHSHGAALGQRTIEAYERHVISGYEGTDPAPQAQIRCYELLILLDKWSALVAASRTGGGMRRRAHVMSLQLAHGYIRGQGERLLDLAQAAAH
jgi:aminoglycoside phosphotransferase (APT) family kinase protein